MEHIGELADESSQKCCRQRITSATILFLLPDPNSYCWLLDSMPRAAGPPDQTPQIKDASSSISEEKIGVGFDLLHADREAFLV
jgi:hypothetical protein